MHNNYYRIQDLSCPLDKGKLHKKEENLVCDKCNTNYQIKDGIPLMLPPNASKADLEYFKTQIQMHLNLVEVYTKKRYLPHFSRIYQDYWNRKLLKLARLRSYMKILDLGCGTGIFLPTLEKHGCEVYGIDLSWAMLRASIEVDAPKSSRIVASGDSLPFCDGFFDAVVCRGAIHHFPDLSRSFHEIYRVLKIGGILAFSEPSNDFLLNKIARNIMYSKSEEFHEEDEGFERKKILPKIKSAGFVPIKSKGFGFLAYILAGFPDKIGILNHLPGASYLTRFLIGIDEILQRMPYIQNWGLHWMLFSRKV